MFVPAVNCSDIRHESYAFMSQTTRVAYMSHVFYQCYLGFEYTPEVWSKTLLCDETATWVNSDSRLPNNITECTGKYNPASKVWANENRLNIYNIFSRCLRPYQIWASERRFYTCNNFSRWLRTCTLIKTGPGYLIHGKGQHLSSTILLCKSKKDNLSILLKI